MVNSPPSFAPSPIGLDSAATELKALFEETRPLDLPWVAPEVHPGVSHSVSNGVPTADPLTAEGLRAHWLWPRSLVQGVLSVGAIVLTMAVGGLSGAMVAQVYPELSRELLNKPGQVPAMTPAPLLEQFFQGFAQQRSRLHIRAYQWWNKPPTLSVNPATLNQWKPGELEAEIDRLLSESQTLETEMANLEKQLGVTLSSQEPSPTQRLLALRQSLVSPSSATLPLQMTLPTDLLFEDGKTSLKPEATELLQNLENSVRTELNLPPGAQLTLTIATHTDNVGNASQNLDLSFQRSRSLQVYLSQRLNTPGVIWNAVGYGATRPLADNSIESNRQRNRRIEITLDW